MHLRSSFLRILIFTFWFLSAGDQICLASYLSIRGSGDLKTFVTADGIRVDGTYEMTNGGDEEAKNVFPEIRLWGAVWTGEGVNLKPQERHVWRIVEFSVAAASSPAKLQGTFPLYIYRHYDDANGYSFSAPEVTPLNISMVEQSGNEAAITQKISVSNCVQNFSGSVTLTNHSASDKEITITPFTSEELTALIEPNHVSLHPGETREVSLTGLNVRGIPSSAYAVYVVSEWNDQGAHYMVSDSKFVAIQQPNKTPYYLLLLMMAAVLPAFALYARVYRRLREEYDPQS